MRKLIYHVATTADGFIAHADHTVDGFLNEGDHTADYLAALKNDYDTALMGRNTYAFGVRWGVTNPYPWMKQYVFSSTMRERPNEHIELISSDAIALVRRLKAEPGKDIYLCGGAGLATDLLKAGLIDEVLLKQNPVVFGTGIGLFHAVKSFVPLELQSTRAYANGVLLLRYAITNASD